MYDVNFSTLMDFKWNLYLDDFSSNYEKMKHLNNNMQIALSY